MIVTGKLEGFAEFEKLLKDLEPRVEKKILQAAVTSTMREAKNQIKAAAPMHADEQSAASKIYGSLKKNIRVIKLKRVRRGEKGARVTTGDAFWGFIYEKGSRYQPARPWFAPTFRNITERLIDILGQRIGEGIEKVALEK